MPVIFPPIETASPEGLLAIGGELNCETLFTAYSQGIFPWPISENSTHMTWFSPNPRGVLNTNQLHFSKSFKKFLKNSSLTIKFNTCFFEVIQSCAKVKRPNEEGTWINKKIIDGFYDFYKHHNCYSVEVYKNKHELVGGLYGVIIGKYLTGESMFHFETNASKLALTALIKRIKTFNIPFLDTQMVTPIIKNLGGSYMERELFINQLHQLVQAPVKRDEIFPQNLEMRPSQLLD